ncbi:PREDICTED: uncharacterized protein LOC107356592 [Paramuricea clavata]|uniref:PREDICTED: uncharacterized protein LOC107356592 n=1 Tax=Paramuricea clavata TaxID=317549 RepID=A0A7D9I3P3_PARCT|nr:PREDICTED: uncharacterized protein LOC107356592 [Paramuricea clavata]
MVTTSTGDQISVPIRNTWSRTFMCLTKRNAVTPPSTMDKMNMALAGLEEQTITFTKSGNSDHVHQKILQAFPMLAEVGGYEILRTGERSSRQLMVISIPPVGYTVLYLKSTIASAKGYIRPLQRDIVLKPVALTDPAQSQISMSPKVACVNCHQDIAMDTMRAHLEICGGGSSRDYDEITVTSIGDCEDLESDEINLETGALSQLQTIFSNLPPEEVRQAMENADGCIEAATATLLGESDDDLIMSISGIASATTTSKDSAESQEGTEELKRDILGYYKDKTCKLTAKPRVRFEGEEGVGSGPIREFFLCAMKLVHEGIGGTGKPILFFEGEEDHKLPTHDQSARSTGAFKAIGRIIGHSVLHWGPLLYGLSPVVKRYWTASASDGCDGSGAETILSSITLEDIPDIDLRGYISQLEDVAPDVRIPEQLKEDLTPYVFESGLDIDLLHSDRKLIAQGLMMYQVIDKRKQELDDILKGMNEVQLHSFLACCTVDVLESIFPTWEKQFNTFDEVKSVSVFEETEGHENTISFWFQYLSDLAKYESGKPTLTDMCCFWTATNILPPRSCSLQVKFDYGTGKLPYAETCFYSLTLPTMHKTYEMFKKYMDIVMLHGSLGIDHS